MSSLMYWHSNKLCWNPYYSLFAWFLHQDDSPSRSGTCFTQLFPLWVALDETLCHQVWFPPILLGGTSRFSARRYQESESQIHESCCLFFFFTRSFADTNTVEGEVPWGITRVCRTPQQSQGSIGGLKRHPLFCCVYRWFFFPPPPLRSQLEIGWLGSAGVEELRAPLRTGQQWRTRSALSNWVSLRPRN